MYPAIHRGGNAPCISECIETVDSCPAITYNSESRVTGGHTYSHADAAAQTSAVLQSNMIIIASVVVLEDHRTAIDKSLSLFSSVTP